MKTILVVTIDVEPDCTPTWHYSNPLTFAGVTVGIKDILQPLFNEYGIIPTYLLNNVVLEDGESINVLRNLKGEFELGTHLHPEFIEPQKTVFEYAGSKGESNLCLYPHDIEFEKIRNITNMFENRFGYKPISFRAGRFSAGKNTIKCLIDLGYKVDTSVTPHICWNDSSRNVPVDFREVPDQPFFTSPDTFPLSGEPDKVLLEVPVSIFKKPTSLIKENIETLFGIRRKINLFNTIWLRPGLFDFKSFIQLFDHFRKLYYGNKYIVLNMMFHNVEIIPMLSPYTIKEADRIKYYDNLRRFLMWCNHQEVTSESLGGLYCLLFNERYN